ncbi:MAG: lasso RiPP family leader peptide-containing protein [Gloeotrichia echinulata HAB0833]
MTTASTTKKEYSKPQLIEMGSAVSLTLGFFNGFRRDFWFGLRFF